jgi:hypothetical protein
MTDGWIILGTTMINTGPYCGMDIRKSHFSLISGTFSVGGQPMLFFSKLVDETQMSKSPKATRHHNSRKLSLLLPLRAI